MRPQARTDAELSIAAEEFVWDEEGLTHAHAYILPTLTSWLLTAGAETVLDLGCGNGALTAELASAGFKPAGIDCSATGVAIAAQKHRGITFINGHLDDELPEAFHQRFDAVIAIEVIEHLLRPRSIFERAREALRPAGVVIVSTPYHGYFKNLALALTNRFDQHWHPLRDFGHVKFFSRKTLTELFREQRFQVTGYRAVGRIPALAKSMMMRGQLGAPASLPAHSSTSPKEISPITSLGVPALAGPPSVGACLR